MIDVNWLTPHKVRRLTAVGTDGVAYLDYISQTVDTRMMATGSDQQRSRRRNLS